MKKLISFVMGIMIFASFTACNSQENGSSAAETQSVSETSTMSEDKQEASVQTEEASAEAADDNTEAESGKTLVVYYSATGSTARVAGYIAEAMGADTFELVPTEPYTADDLDWTDNNSRVTREHDDESLRNVELENTAVPDWESYDTVFIGYPIWWRIAAWPTNTFVENNDFTGKTVIPFCTSSSSGLGESGELLAEAAGTGNWLTGERFQSGASEETVQEWVNGLGL